VTQMNTRLIRILQFVGFLFALGAGFVVVLNVVTDLPWDTIAALFFSAHLLLCGVSFGVAGLMAENPDRTTKLFSQWLVGSLVVLILVITMYAIL
jgi:hypothetical protein